MFLVDGVLFDVLVLMELFIILVVVELNDWGVAMYCFYFDYMLVFLFMFE